MCTHRKPVQISVTRFRKQYEALAVYALRANCTSSQHVDQDAAACRFDPQSGFYVSLINPGYDRRYGDIRNVLVLAISEDLEHWDVVKTLLHDDTGMFPML